MTVASLNALENGIAPVSCYAATPKGDGRRPTARIDEDLVSRFASFSWKETATGIIVMRMQLLVMRDVPRI